MYQSLTPSTQGIQTITKTDTPQHSTISNLSFNPQRQLHDRPHSHNKTTQQQRSIIRRTIYGYIYPNPTPYPAIMPLTRLLTTHRPSLTVQQPQLPRKLIINSPPILRQELLARLPQGQVGPQLVDEQWFARERVGGGAAEVLHDRGALIGFARFCLWGGVSIEILEVVWGIIIVKFDVYRGYDLL